MRKSRKEYNRTYYEKNREKLLEMYRQYRITNADKIRARTRTPEFLARARQRNKAWRERHGEEYKAQHNAYYRKYRSLKIKFAKRRDKEETWENYRKRLWNEIPEEKRARISWSRTRE